jgi:hypothetical protein
MPGPQYIALRCRLVPARLDGLSSLRGHQPRAAIDAEAGTVKTRGGVLLFIADDDGHSCIHHRATRRAMAHRSIPTVVVSVVAGVGRRTRRDRGRTHELGLARVGGFSDGRE